MLRKIRKFITFPAAILIYKQTIRAIIDYSGFMLIACNDSNREDFQILQNDVLRICCKYIRADKISVDKLHKECKIIGIEQRMRRQLLWLMYLLSKSVEYQHKAPRDTRSANKIIFKVPNKISHQYENSPYYIGTKLWSVLPVNIQQAENIFVFKKYISELYKSFTLRSEQV